MTNRTEGGTAVTSFLTKTDHAADALRAAIASGQIAPGEWIRAEDWAQRLQLSVTPVREALRHLEAIGLVTIHAHRGAQVTKRTRAELMEDCRIRIALEGLAIAIVLERLDDAALAALLAAMRTCAEEYRRVAETGDGQACLESNDQFHTTLYGAANSPRLETMLRNVWSTFPIYTVQLGRKVLLEAADQHEQLIEALAARDVEQANQIIADHATGQLDEVPDMFDGVPMFADTPSAARSPG
jgi:DNA-binding GntR family transcriptional regulator